MIGLFDGRAATRSVSTNEAIHPEFTQANEKLPRTIRAEDLQETSSEQSFETVTTNDAMNNLGTSNAMPSVTASRTSTVTDKSLRRSDLRTPPQKVQKDRNMLLRVGAYIGSCLSDMRSAPTEENGLARGSRNSTINEKG